MIKSVDWLQEYIHKDLGYRIRAFCSSKMLISEITCKHTKHEHPVPDFYVVGFFLLAISYFIPENNKEKVEHGMPYNRNEGHI